ncbi:hypothetical protein V6N13_047265 [Hibiscus sabdariffa]
MARRRSNFISSLKRPDGSRCSDHEVLSTMVCAFYTELLSSSDICNHHLATRGLLQNLSVAEKSSLTMPVSDLEIRYAFFDMDATKVP